MSLIQDALKRQQEETESGRIQLKSAVPPSVPDSMPVPVSPAPRAGPPAMPEDKPPRADPPAMPSAIPPDRPPASGDYRTEMRSSPAQPAPSGKSWKRIAGIIILCVLIAWGGGLAAALVFKKSVAHAWLGAFLPSLSRARPVMEQTSAPPPLPAAEQLPPPEPEPAPAPAPEMASAAVPAPEISPEAAAAPAADNAQKTVADTARAGVHKRDSEAAAPSPAPIPEPVVWPRLKLSAVFSNIGAGQSGARLNNKLVLLGDRIDGVTLVEIRRDSVILKCGNQTRLLKMGMTLY